MGLSQALIRGMMLFLGEGYDSPQPLSGIVFFFFWRGGGCFFFLAGGEGYWDASKEKISPATPGCYEQNHQNKKCLVPETSTGSTIRTLLHGKSSLKIDRWRFLQFFKVVWGDYGKPRSTNENFVVSVGWLQIITWKNGYKFHALDHWNMVGGFRVSPAVVKGCRLLKQEVTLR